MPMRISTACCGSAVLCSRKARWMAVAARTAATVDGKDMRKPSPRDLCTRPPNAMTWSCTIPACNSRMSSASRSPRDRRSAVERTTSVIMTVSSLPAGLPPDKGYLPLDLAAQHLMGCSAPHLPVPEYGRLGGQPHFASRARHASGSMKGRPESGDAYGSDSTLCLWVRSLEILVQNLPEDLLIGIGVRKECHGGAQLDRIDATKDLFGTEPAMRSDDLRTFDKPWA